MLRECILERAALVLEGGSASRLATGGRRSSSLLAYM